MKLSKLKLWNYRCFGSEEQVILIDQLTTFIGNNSAGKTAALSALNCMFSENSNDRILHRSDFHLPKDILPDEMEQQSLYIEAVFEFEELQSGSNGGEYGFTQSRLKTEYDDILSRISLPLTGDGLGHKVWPLLLKGFNGNKATLTFKMIMMLAMYIIETNPYIKQALQMTYSFVFLDEFQDTTAIQYAFVKECFWNSGTKVTSVGDNKQRIMVWAGAVKTIFNDFYRELNPKCIRLIMNHRSAPRLVALQKAMYESLKEKATEVCASGNWAEDDGNIALFIADNEQLEAAAVSKDILLKISNGVEPHDICILCKQKPQDYASAIIEELEKHGVRARIETGYQDLIKEPIVDLSAKHGRLARGIFWNVKEL